MNAVPDLWFETINYLVCNYNVPPDDASAMVVAHHNRMAEAGETCEAATPERAAAGVYAHRMHVNMGRIGRAWCKAANKTPLVVDTQHGKAWRWLSPSDRAHDLPDPLVGWSDRYDHIEFDSEAAAYEYVGEQLMYCAGVVAVLTPVHLLGVAMPPLTDMDE